MAHTEADICNLALDMLGADVINTLDDRGVAAERCKRNYPLIRDAALRAYPWNCATRLANIAVDGVTPPFKYQRRYALPNGPGNDTTGEPHYCLRVIKINEEAKWQLRYRVFGRYLYTDEEGPLELEYTARLEDVTQYDALLVQAIACRLAWTLAFAFSKSASLVESLKGSYPAILQEARDIDAQEGSPDDEDAHAEVGSDFLASRLGHR